ncbi:hypothetical protein DPMN_119765 [Dreissena polymorpha]|uniref:Uncharacterized protein n=1 Tax=Dreissena polymorpha TaxID=45954 RepID=A0A9D4GJ61_DREPO|nr:hypothetical protein DPMN_119765 [Dreissena polymorpha]
MASPRAEELLSKNEPAQLLVGTKPANSQHYNDNRAKKSKRYADLSNKMGNNEEMLQQFLDKQEQSVSKDSKAKIDDRRHGSAICSDSSDEKQSDGQSDRIILCACGHKDSELDENIGNKAKL